jgi:hypothetical protein
MTPIQDMTLDECRDQIAVAMGWMRQQTYKPTFGGNVQCEVWLRGISELQPGRTFDNYRGSHPVQDTIDSIAASLPPGHQWRSIESDDDLPHWWLARVFHGTTHCCYAEADNELLARARCCVAAWRKYKENEQ